MNPHDFGGPKMVIFWGPKSGQKRVQKMGQKGPPKNGQKGPPKNRQKGGPKKWSKSGHFGPLNLSILQKLAVASWKIFLSKKPPSAPKNLGIESGRSAKSIFTKMKNRNPL